MKTQKAKALWKMKAAKDRGEEFDDLERKDNILGRNKRRLELWEEHLKDPTAALDKALKCVENSCKGVSRPETVWWVWSPLACAGFLQRLWEKPIWEGVWPDLDPWE